ncbi:MAG: LacI family DNA-binding transcriptional regulator [Pyrinomonadaceae bacterium]|nr:LacI family DNA-binding transcriptional regulator [Sphingobacteriaceae bacterium]
MKPQVTLKKLADMLNLSISTVSRSLTNHPDIAEETRTKVKELANLLEYEPNTHAINLRTRDSKEFGIIIPAISNYFYNSFISSLEEEARRFGYSLVILQSGEDPAIEQENLKKCKQNRVAGVFVSITNKTTDIDNFLKLTEQQTPVIFFDKVPAFEACNKVCVADASAATMAAERIILKKKKHVLAIFGNKEMSITKRRRVAFEAAFLNYPTKTKLSVKYANNTEEALKLVLKNVNGEAKPDAIFCMSDEILVGVMKAIQMMKLRLPDDIGVITISDGFFPQLYYPEISYVETSGYKLGKLAFTRMLACLAGSYFVQELTVDSILVDGGSL